MKACSIQVKILYNKSCSFYRKSVIADGEKYDGYRDGNFNFSPKRQALLDSKIGEFCPQSKIHKLIDLCRTR